MISISSEMSDRVSKTFRCEGSIKLGNKTIYVDQTKIDVYIKYLWIANVTGATFHGNYGLSMINTDIGLFGAYLVGQSDLHHNKTLFPVIKVDTKDLVFEQLNNTSLFPMDRTNKFGDYMTCAIQITSPALLSEIYFRGNFDPQIESLEDAIIRMTTILSK